ncbi:rare lipoprotein A [Lacibacter cauensis]|uniref:Probable endolytic peptidoglycan transglycosylase RlpA n=1 Tax=Lacibacter cauensis TaxID=510947 RepID=A0A562SRJ0_9BACT|nr:septal ring lytic transglycosylase RlpA family protein [Lacibacter cauensis]TWI83877.1 rare lipoprotein A [Lacibacter cauensis]
MPKSLLLSGLLFLFIQVAAIAQQDSSKPTKKATGKSKIQYGLASFYSNKFNGRKTSSGEIFSQQKLTAAHNTLALGTYVRVTNLRNGKTVVVKINDRLHHRNKRVIDLSRAAATKLGFIKSGLTRVKIEVLGKKPVSR